MRTAFIRFLAIGILLAESGCIFASNTHEAPFISCASDGQMGVQPPLDKPQNNILPQIPADLDLAFFQASGTPGVLGPRGWHCAGLEGSGGSTLVVTPEHYEPREFMSFDSRRARVLRGEAIQISYFLSGTSSRFDVAETAARLFPKAAAFVKSVANEGFIRETAFKVGPYPDDRLVYLNDFSVEFQTPPNSDGEGTRTFLGESSQPINGVVIMDKAGEDDLVKLAIRLPASQNKTTNFIIANLETRSNLW